MKRKSISTKDLYDALERRRLKNSGVSTKEDAELLELGTRKDGGPQIGASPATKVFKDTGIDIGRYMNSGYATDLKKYMSSN